MRPTWLSSKHTRSDASRAGRWSTWVRRTFFSGLALVLAGIGLVAFSAPTYAHNNNVNSKGVCATPLGTGYVVTWTVANDFNLPETGSVVSVLNGTTPLDVNTVVPNTYSIPATPDSSGPPYTWSNVKLTQTLPASTTPGILTLNITSKWKGGFTIDDSGTFDLSSLDCAAAGTPAVSVVKSVSPTGSVVIGSNTPLVYTLAVSNTGTAATTAPIVVTDQAPTGTTLVAGSPACATGGPPACSVSTSGAGLITWTIPPGVGVNQHYTLTFSVTINSSDSAGNITNAGSWDGPSCATTCSTNTVVTPITTPPVTSPTQVTPTTLAPATSPAVTAPVTSPSTTTSPSTLAFTGAPVSLQWFIGFGALILGSGLILASRLRLRRPRHASSKR